MATKKVTTKDAPDGTHLFKSLFNELNKFDIMNENKAEGNPPDAKQTHQLVHDVMKDKGDWGIDHRVTRLQWWTSDSSVELLIHHAGFFTDIPETADLTLKKGNRVIDSRELKFI